MTRDGVNDAPVLMKADCGIAVSGVSGATDAARAAAAIVLLTPGLSVIIDAIKESRKNFQRMNSYAIYRIAETLRVLLFMTLAILVFNFYPVTAIMGTRLSSRTRPGADPHVPEAFRRRASHHLSHPHPRAVLVDPLSPDPVPRGPRHPGNRHPDRRLWTF
ncbi:hypothetical protein ABIB25_005665 [Nakamurella sp. UYEF19]